MKDKWRHYATKTRFEQKGYFFKHCDGGSGRKANETSRCDRLLESGKEEKIVIIPMYGRVVETSELADDIIYVGEENGEGKVGIGSTIQSSGEISSEVGSIEPGSDSSCSGNEKIRKRKDGKASTSRKKKG